MPAQLTMAVLLHSRREGNSLTDLSMKKNQRPLLPPRTLFSCCTLPRSLLLRLGKIYSPVILMLNNWQKKSTKANPRCNRWTNMSDAERLIVWFFTNWVGNSRSEELNAGTTRTRERHPPASCCFTFFFFFSLSLAYKLNECCKLHLSYNTRLDLHAVRPEHNYHDHKASRSHFSDLEETKPSGNNMNATRPRPHRQGLVYLPVMMTPRLAVHKAEFQLMLLRFFFFIEIKRSGNNHKNPFWISTSRILTQIKHTVCGLNPTTF